MSLSIIGKCLFVGWLAAIVVLSLIPHPPVPESGFWGWDKVQHAGAYGVLTLLGMLAIPAHQRSAGRRFLFAAVLAVVVGALMEIAQGCLTTTRSAEAGDLVADAVGAACAVGLAWLVALCRSPKKWSAERSVQ